jgi:poly(hydroxyalkanoate) depolymerase family esterase
MAANAATENSSPTPAIELSALTLEMQPPGTRADRSARALLSRIIGTPDFKLPDLRGLGGRHPPPADIAPPEGRFLVKSFSSAIGTRAYKLYVPSSQRDGPRPLIIMLHGCTQTADDFAAGTRMNFAAEAHGCFVAYPEQASSANAQRCWNWFKRGDQERGTGEPAIIAGIARQIISDYGIDVRRVYVAGLSAGGAAAAIMGEAYPDIFAAVGVHSGLACGAARDLPSAFAAMRGDAPVRSGGHAVPTIVFHGDRDTTVHPRNGEQVAARAGGKLQIVDTPATSPPFGKFTRSVRHDARGQSVLELWQIHGAGHAWSGGSAAGSFTDPSGPNATTEMLRFFLEHARRDA